MSETAVVVVEFALTPEHCDELGRAWRERTGSFSGSLGEHHVSRFTPDEATKLIRDTGLEPIDVLQAEQLAARYLRDVPHLSLARANVYLIARSAPSI